MDPPGVPPKSSCTGERAAVPPLRPPSREKEGIGVRKGLGPAWQDRRAAGATRGSRTVFRESQARHPGRVLVCSRQQSGRGHVNDPSAGSPTETLLRLLLPLNDQVWTSFRQLEATKAARNASPEASLNHSIGSSDGRCVLRAGT